MNVFRKYRVAIVSIVVTITGFLYYFDLYHADIYKLDSVHIQKCSDSYENDRDSFMIFVRPRLKRQNTPPSSIILFYDSRDQLVGQKIIKLEFSIVSIDTAIDVTNSIHYIRSEQLVEDSTIDCFDTIVDPQRFYLGRNFKFYNEAIEGNIDFHSCDYSGNFYSCELKNISFDSSFLRLQITFEEGGVLADSVFLGTSKN